MREQLENKQIGRATRHTIRLTQHRVERTDSHQEKPRQRRRSAPFLESLWPPVALASNLPLYSSCFHRPDQFANNRPTDMGPVSQPRSLCRGYALR